MKSFKIVEVKIEREGNFIILDLIDGIIINKEISEDSWLLEISTSPDFKDILEPYVEQEVDLLVTITRPTNEPARFKGIFNEMNEIDNAISLIFTGDIIAQNPNYAENLLAQLIDEGFEGEELLNEFTAMMESKTELKTSDD
ncbi:MAG TPA: YwpF-like family protein [Candidatus Salinicoccus stercoripullorum]|uniref:YwpF-like family protein n=1 Tax=Candidatus Salinicoccus stercoripullorum TaxID=2838756 RepID=A0A9D1QJY5_9STAP|nr:YwpF-like family protein [Candidatus Salinicoccus stercoripullorum]